MLICVNGGVFVTEPVSRWHWCSGRRAPRFGLKSQPHTDRSSSFLMMVPVPLEGGCCHSNRCSLGGMLSARNRVEGGRGNGERGEAFEKRRVLKGLFNTQTACSQERALHFVSFWLRKGLSFTLHHRHNKNTFKWCMVFLLDWTVIQLNQAKSAYYTTCDDCRETLDWYRTFHKVIWRQSLATQTFKHSEMSQNAIHYTVQVQAALSALLQGML